MKGHRDRSPPDVELLRQRGDDQEQHITVLTHHSSIMYDYKAIPQRLPGNGLLCRAEKDTKTEKQEMTGLEELNVYEDITDKRGWDDVQFSHLFHTVTIPGC